MAEALRAHASVICLQHTNHPPRIYTSMALEILLLRVLLPEDGGIQPEKGNFSTLFIVQCFMRRLYT